MKMVKIKNKRINLDQIAYTELIEGRRAGTIPAFDDSDTTNLFRVLFSSGTELILRDDEAKELINYLDNI